jgi:hypothetical protein
MLTSDYRIDLRAKIDKERRESRRLSGVLGEWEKEREAYDRVCLLSSSFPPASLGKGC